MLRSLAANILAWILGPHIPRPLLAAVVGAITIGFAFCLVELFRYQPSVSIVIVIVIVVIVSWLWRGSRSAQRKDANDQRN